MKSLNGCVAGCVALLLAATAVSAQDAAVKTEATGTVKPRPRIGLVLSGGGARGAAHIGVLKVLEEMRVPVDYITGTSMGSIVGGSYASGNTVDQMLIDITNIKSADLATDAPPRQDITFRRKQDDLHNYIGPEIGIRRGKLLLPKGVVTGVGLEAVLRDLAKVKGTVDFDALPIPFRACATDIGTGKMVVFRSGDLAAVMRASMSVPGAIAPAQVDGMSLVDGGLTRNLPVDVAREMGADVVIAVNLGTPLMRPDQIDSLLSVSGQMINILTEQNVQASLASLRPDDILILPELGDYSSTDFDHMPDTVPIGVAAARKVADRLAQYSLTKEEYEKHRSRQTAAAAAAPRVIDEIRVSGMKRVNPKIITEHMEMQVGKPVETKVVDADMRRIYGRGDFERVGYHLIEEPGKQVLVVDAVEKSWGPDYVRFGLNMSAESDGDAYFNVLASHRKTWINRFGAEWKNDVQAGQTTRLSTEFYQPLSVHRYLFVAPYVAYDQYLLKLFRDRVELATYNERTTVAGFDIGSQITKYGELRIGVLYGPRSFTLNSGPDTLAPSDDRSDIGALRARLRVDQLDSVKFPRSGYALTAILLDSRTDLGARDSYRRWEGDLVAAASSGDNTIQLGLKGGGPAGHSRLPLYDQFSWGGFLRQSGYRSGQFYGESLVFGRLVYLRKLSQAVLTEGVYAGASVEAGRVGGQTVPGNPTGLVTSGSVILAADTPLGPMYLSFGVGEDGNRSTYFYLGRP